MKKTLPSWNLSSLFKTNTEAKTAVAVLQKGSKQFEEQYKGKMQSAEILLKAVQSYEKIVDGMHRVSAFAYLSYITHMNENDRKSFYQFANESLASISTHLTFFTIEINKLPKKIIEDKSLAKYKTFFRNILEFKPYELPEEIERVLIKKSVTSSSAWSQFFDEFSCNLRFKYGKKELNSSEIFNLLSEKSSKARKTAAQAIEKTFGDNIKVFTFITNTLAKDKEIEDTMRGFKDPISSRNIANLIEDEIVQSLVSSVKKSYNDTAHKYYKLKAKILGQTKLNYWDRNAPMPFTSERKYSFDEAKDLTLEAYQEFSPRMARIGKSFFDKNWIDVPVREGKDSGAFSHPTCTTANPFIMLNFLGKPRDVATLAHELGHGVHQFLAKEQGALLCQTPLTLAETASVFGEQLVFQKMLAGTKSKKERLAMLSSKIEDMLNTSVRQIAFCDFETQVHAKRKQGELSTDEICNIWLAVQKESLGSAFNFTEGYKYYWSYIPHFIHSPFYVYAYAFGDILVNSLYGIYKSGKIKNFEEKYIEMLAAGGSLRHKELLAPFGIDISKEAFWRGGMSVLADMIKVFEKEIAA